MEYKFSNVNLAKFPAAAILTHGTPMYFYIFPEVAY